MKKHLPTLCMVLVFVVGLSLLLYPTISDYWNSFHQTQVISGYGDSVARLDEISYDYVWQAARQYNADLLQEDNRFFPTEDMHERYLSLLNVAGNGVMGFIEIPELSVRLPIYHSTDEAVLQVAVGHIEGSSLPVGGAGTHCLLSGHRGLPSAKLFSSLDQMAVGDVFMLHVLDETLTYEVDQILVVEPGDVSALELDPLADLCTLVTCTPYGINSHRLLVRGHRIETQKEKAPVTVTADAVQVERWKVALAVAGPLLILVMMIGLLSRRRG